MKLHRAARFAGSWYPGREEELVTTLREFCVIDSPQPAMGLVSPHAGYRYSGRVAGAGYGAVEVPDLVVLLAPNHTGVGPSFSLFPDGSWGTPLGPVPISEDMNQELLVAFDLLREDSIAHEDEHSAELQLPFLRFRNPDVQISVVVMRSPHLEELTALGEALATVIRTMARSVLVVASSDMNHFADLETTKRKDNLALAPLLRLDAPGLYRVVRREKISMCGASPAVSMLACCCELGAKSAKLIEHSTSAEASGDTRRVVGYASVTVS